MSSEKDLFGLWEQEKQRLSRRRLFSLLGTGGGMALTATTLASCGFDMGGTNATAGATTQAPPPTTALTPQGSTPTPAPTQAPTKVPAVAAAPTPMGTVLAHRANVPVNSSISFPIANQKNPGVLIHLPSQQFVAFDTTCTHQQCSVSYNAMSHLLECPCHGAVFNPSNNGSVVKGPAMSPLTTIRVIVNADGTITRPS